jgi:hypothetical protein
MIRYAALLFLLAAPALAQEGEPFDGDGYVLGCDTASAEAACWIAVGGWTLMVPEAMAAPGLVGGLAALPPVTAVRIAGTLSEMGDSSATLALTEALHITDDPHEGALQAMQGTWRPEGEEAPFALRVDGLTWEELEMDEPVAAYAMAVGDTCARSMTETGGTETGGTAISLYLLGGDAEAAACWQVEEVAGDRMVLRDVEGAQGQVAFARD